MVAATEPQMEPIPSVKDLASSDPSLRRKNLQQIISHLEQRSPSQHLTHTQALQLWRGFHVSLYMHDSKNQLSVQTLIATLANTFHIIRRKDFEVTSSVEVNGNSGPNANQSTGGDEEDEFGGFDDDDDDSSTHQATTPSKTEPDETWLTTYTLAFWETIAREWSTIDQWRMDKFLLLIRFALREIFNICLQSYFGLEQFDDNSVADFESTTEERDDRSKISASKKRKATSENGRKDEVVSRSKKSKATATSAKPLTSTSTTRHSKSSSISTHHQPPNPSITHFQILLLYQQPISPLSPRSRKVTDGLRLHLLDIYVDELLKAVDALKERPDFGENRKDSDEDEDEMKTLLGETFMAPIREVAGDGLTKHVRVKAKEVLEDFEGRV